MKPAHVPGTSLGSLYDMQIRVPNITGSFPIPGWHASTVPAFLSGSFAYESMSGTNVQNSGGANAMASFMASRSSDAYGSSSTVQPAALRTIFCIKF